MRLGNFIVGCLTAFMANELHTLMLGTDPMLQGWLGFVAWVVYIIVMYGYGASHCLNIPRR